MAPPFPKSLQFQVEFATEEACQKYLARVPLSSVWASAGLSRQKLRWQCAACRHQVSLTSGTVLHNTKTPLTVWFWAAYLMTTDSEVCRRCYCSVSGLSRYETAWMMLHKLRRAMVNAAREPLHGEVEVDDTWIGGPQAGLRGSFKRGKRSDSEGFVVPSRRSSALEPCPVGGAAGGSCVSRSSCSRHNRKTKSLTRSYALRPHPPRA